MRRVDHTEARWTIDKGRCKSRSARQPRANTKHLCTGGPHLAPCRSEATSRWSLCLMRRGAWRARSILLPWAIASAGILLVSSRLQSVSAALAPPGGCLLIPRRQVGAF